MLPEARLTIESDISDPVEPMHPPAIFSADQKFPPTAESRDYQGYAWTFLMSFSHLKSFHQDDPMSGL